jgi:hypothetical protein
VDEARAGEDRPQEARAREAGVLVREARLALQAQVGAHPGAEALGDLRVASLA